ncbi:MAG: methyl-accepting chemotaxis protein [Reichenbachiella sp.]
MRGFLRGVGLLVLLVLVGHFGYSQEDNKKIRFDSYTTEDGLSHANTGSVYEDQFGFIWICTDDGVNVFDGYSFKIFRNEFDNDQSLESSKTNNVGEDADGTLWVATSGGLNKFDRDRGVFKRYISDKNKPNWIAGDPRYFHTDSRGDFWIGTTEGLFKYLPETDNFKVYQHNESNTNSLVNNNVSGVVEDKNANLWIGTSDGVSKLSLKDDQFENFQIGENSRLPFTEREIRSIYADSQNRIWVCYFDNGLSFFDADRLNMQHLQYDEIDPMALTHRIVQEVAENKLGEIWIATDGGLGVYNENRTVTSHYNDELLDNGLISEIIIKIKFDSNNNLWVSTWLGGVGVYDKDKYGFELFQNNPKKPESLSNNRAVGFAEDQYGNYAVAADGGSINLYDRKTGKFKHITPESHGLTNDKTLALAYDKNGNLWIGMWDGGINIYNPKTEQIKKYWPNASDPKSLISQFIFSIYEDSNQNMWIGSWDKGISRYNWDTDNFTNYSNDRSNANNLDWTGINQIIEDKQGNIWFSDEASGVFVYSPGSESFKSFKANGKEGDISSNKTASILIDSKNEVWVATMGGGLNKFDRKSQTFTAYRMKDGLPSESVIGILEDNQGKIWMSTNNGLSMLNPDDMSFKNYNISDGLQGNQFSPRALLKLSNGQLIFGGNNGYNIFDPLDLVDNPKIPSVYITDFKLFNKIVPIGDKEVLKKDIMYTEDIELNYKQNFLSFEFLSLNYRHSVKNKYRYMMDGLDEDWIEAGNERKAFYTGVAPGDYVFKVKGSNNDGIWNDVPVEVSITIIPPFWATWWFRMVIVLLIIAGLVAFYKWRTRAAKEVRKLLERKVKEATEQVTNQNAELQEQSELLKMAIDETNFVVAEAVESGNFAVRIDTDQKSGSWKALGDSINQLFESVLKPFNTINHIVNKMAEGDLTERYTDDARGEILKLAKNLNKAMDNLTNLLLDITGRVDDIKSSANDMLVTGEDMTVSTGEIANTISEMSRGAQEQVIKVDESSNLIEGVLASSGEMGDQADEINQTALMGVSKSNEGMKQMGELDVNMKDILAFSAKTTESIDTLTKRSEEITSVLRIIKDIASQTNLLALNAAIQASQAGEVGRGFAVVAEEIRKLAEDSKKSAGEIEELVTSVQDDTASTAKIISDMSQRIKKGEQATNHSLSAFEEISSYYSKTLEKSEQIVYKTKEQTNDIGEVVNIINGVVVIAEETAAGTEETASSSSELSTGMDNYNEKSKIVAEISDELKEKVSKFLLRKDT